MSVEHGTPSPITTLLASIADPAVEVDAEGRLAAWNGAAAERFELDDASLGADADDRLRRWRGGARRVALADSDRTLIVWSLDEDGLGPDEIELSKAEVVGRISGSALHELKNMLMAGIGVGGLLRSEPISRETYDIALGLEQQGQRATDLADSLLNFSRVMPHRDRAIKVGPIIRHALEVLGHPCINMEHRATASDTLPEVEVDESELRHVLFALFVNALEAQGVQWQPHAPQMPGRLIVSASHRDDALGNRVRVAIEDGAPPVPETEREGLFTGAASRSGRDLVVANALARGFGGRLSYEPVAGGNRIVLDLPVAGTRLPLPPAEPIEFVPVVLLCDEDVFIRSLLTRMMDRRKYQSLEARTGRDAVATAASEHIDFVIAEGKLSDLPGAALYDALIAARPALAERIVLLSGDPTDGDLAELSARTGVPVLPKPLDNARLDDLLKAAFES